MKKTIAAFVLSLPLLLGATAFAQEGHEGHSHAPQTVKKDAAKKEAKPAAVARKVTEEEIGKDAACAVTGEKVKVAEDTISMSYKDKIYYFCCPGCDKSFIANPEKYLNKKPAAQAKKYVCPMGEYEGDKPGKCPKCGMNLVEKK